MPYSARIYYVYSIRKAKDEGKHKRVHSIHKNDDDDRSNTTIPRGCDTMNALLNVIAFTCTIKG